MWATGAYGYLLDYLVWLGLLLSLLTHTVCFFRLPVRSGQRRLRLMVGNGLVAVTLLGFVGFVAESYLRFVSTTTDVFGVTLTSQRWFRAYPRLNSLRFRDVEWKPRKPAGVRRIALVGDSFTYGWGINEVSDRFTELLQKRFEERSPGQVEVMNMAWVGWDTQEELRALQTLLPDYGIDEVVLCYLANDIEPLLAVSAEFDPTRPPRCRWFNTSTSFLLDYLYYRVAAPRLYQGGAYWDWLADGFDNEAIWQGHAETLRAFAEFCKQNGATFRVVLIPFIIAGGNRFDEKVIHGRLSELLTDLSVPTLDLLQTVRSRGASELVVNRHDPHPNEIAHQLFAEEIWKEFYAERK